MRIFTVFQNRVDIESKKRALDESTNGLKSLSRACEADLVRKCIVCCGYFNAPCG